MAEPSRLASALEYLGGLDAAVAPKLRAVSDAIDPVNVARRAGLNLPMAQQAAEAAHFVGPGADIEGMVNDAREGNAAFGRGDMLGALGGYGSAAMAIPMMALPGSVKDVKAGVNALADALQRRPQRPIPAWHASPHNFDKFDLDKIGTGQGAASYGHGIYAAESPAVSGPLGSYDMEFSKAKIRKLLGQDASADPTEEGAHLADLFRKIRAGKSDHDMALDYGPPDGKGYARGLSDAATVRDNIAKLYELRLHAAPEDFLDQDAMLKNMDPALLEKLGSLGVKSTEAAPTFKGRDIYDAFPTSDNTNLIFNARIARQLREQGGHLPSALDAVEGRIANWRPIFDDTIPNIELERWREMRPKYEDAYTGMGMLPSPKRGKEVYDDLVKERETNSFLPPGELYANGKASRDLREAGVPGMRYLDGVSRSAGEGTRNYVIFAPEIIEIVKKYGFAGALMGGAAGGGSTNKEPE
jgi:hypothetical protein